MCNVGRLYTWMYTTGTPNRNESLSIVSRNFGGISVQCRLRGNSVKCFFASTHLQCELVRPLIVLLGVFNVHVGKA